MVLMLSRPSAVDFLRGWCMRVCLCVCVCVSPCGQKIKITAILNIAFLWWNNGV